MFHQVEGLMIDDCVNFSNLKGIVEAFLQTYFEDTSLQVRFRPSYFPFTEPSYELEIFFNGEWLEVLGCGVMEQTILKNASLNDEHAWAFGLGLERLAMVLFDIPDIRLFWTDDPRFTKQFEPHMFRSGGKGMQKFKSYSKYPPCFKDVSFWLPDDSEFTENSLCEIVRSVAGGLVEEVKLIDDFINPKTGKVSNCFRITYRSMDRSLTDEEINQLQDSVREQMIEKLGVTLR